ncbi:MAG: polymer-forming cytoskeletal protein [Holophagales bacterium]|jgi:cytoskeletal protein CcmA (bactofilin family)|nr:polymer-forming cytoskeletal protein [Holophagales bacterium]
MFNTKSSNTPDTSKGMQSPSPFSSSASSPREDSPTTSASPSFGGYKPNMDLTSNSIKPSVISEEVVLTGNIKTPGALHIEGTVIGDLEVTSLVIGPTGTLQGNVNCSALNIRGKFKGASTCKELTISSSAQIDAKITYEEITLQRGAGLRGELHAANYVE